MLPTQNPPNLHGGILGQCGHCSGILFESLLACCERKFQGKVVIVKQLPACSDICPGQFDSPLVSFFWGREDANVDHLFYMVSCAACFDRLLLVSLGNPCQATATTPSNSIK